ncbi:sigma factor-like helix-turn-helix DNA-binding protein [Lamprobacter modestohalophilus]|uniref:sigma factor-like helix-turn-helix DNA-binding protein n=1 Tax=Lamprobacter modestohalophilus TaxID=1064514 RepID=UPI002ADEB405|nr:sigma factor-like helix-turn-helix DNA-binding protein [Lamprobacter modestohalophilus]MEA1050463.1 sigma factor-like helix-turn-helix DNA-binding protein [Lamprobacter modestohalophilus]
MDLPLNTSVSANPGTKPPSYDGCTLEEATTELGVSIERARQIEAQALRKLRFFCWRHGWNYHLLMGD